MVTYSIDDILKREKRMAGNFISPVIKTVSQSTDSQHAQQRVKDRPAYTPASNVGDSGTMSSGLVLTIGSQVRGGKNNMGINSKTGAHYPRDKKWVVWRDQTVAEIRRQLPAGFVTINRQANVRLDYYAGDLIGRDQPMVLDALWHCLEKAGVVENDTLLWAKESERFYTIGNPKAVITFL